MVLSNLLFSSISKKLKIETSLIKEETLYAERLLEKTKRCSKISSDFENIKQLFNTSNSFSENCYVTYIINIFFMRANTVVQITDTKGQAKLLFTSGLVKLSGKQKRNRRIAIIKLLTLLHKKASFVKSSPVTLHLHNILFYKNFLINKLVQHFFVKAIRSYQSFPYNGCRKRKVRRKKHARKTLKKGEMAEWFKAADCKSVE